MTDPGKRQRDLDGSAPPEGLRRCRDTGSWAPHADLWEPA
jgi:hypothetical protein